MIAVSRRQAIGGAIGVTAGAMIPSLQAFPHRVGGSTPLVHDQTLLASQRLSELVKDASVHSVPIEGDRVRFAQRIFSAGPDKVSGLTRYADWLLIAGVGREQGYRAALILEGRGAACSGAECLPAWNRLARMARSPGADWLQLFGSFVVGAGGSPEAWPLQPDVAHDHGLTLGWLLVRSDENGSAR